MSSDRSSIDPKRVSADVASQLNSMMQATPKKVQPASTQLSLRDLIGILYDSIIEMKAKGYSAADICEFIAQHSAMSIAPGTLNNYLAQEGKKRKQQRRQQQRNQQGVKQSSDAGLVIESDAVITVVRRESPSLMMTPVQFTDSFNADQGQLEQRDKPTEKTEEVPTQASVENPINSNHVPPNLNSQIEEAKRSQLPDRTQEIDVAEVIKHPDAKLPVPVSLLEEHCPETPLEATSSNSVMSSKQEDAPKKKVEPQENRSSGKKSRFNDLLLDHSKL